MTSRARSHARPTAGFTLIEMIVVLIILGLMLGLVMARGPMSSRTLTARAAAGDIADALREARARAIGSDRPVNLTLDLRARIYRIDDRPPHPLPAGFDIKLVTVAGETRRGEAPGIRFDPDGSSTGGRIDLIQGKRKLEIGVDWLTGRVRVIDVS